MAYVYILKSLDDGRYYIGSTTNLKQRLRHHFSKATPSTKRFGNIKIVFTQQYKTLEEARSIERKLKKWKRRDYIEKIIKERIIRTRP